MNICLGTAQFMPGYGISNNQLRLNKFEKSNIVDKCRNLKISTIDTAPYYGDAEKVLGQIGVSDFDIVSKIPSLSHVSNTFNVYDQVCESIHNLKVKKLKSLLFYDSNDFIKLFNTGVVEALKQEGLCEKIGVSIYHPEELQKLEMHHWPEVVQLPLNIFDQRFAISGWLEKLKSRSTIIYARSIFFQGLCLLSPHQIPEFAKPYTFLWDKHNLHHTNLDKKVSTCIDYVANKLTVDYMIFGVTDPFQLQNIYDIVNRPRTPVSPENQWVTDIKFLDPRLWTIKKL